MSLLQVRGLETHYGSSQVLFGVDLEIKPGEVVGLLGRNGMGKTSLIRSVLGLTPSRALQHSFAGKALQKMSADRIARLGVALVPEGRQIFPNLSVHEHLSAFASLRNGSTTPWTVDRIYSLFPRLLERKNNLGNQLSGGEQQMLAIGRALATNPRLLVLDEATEGLAPLIREEIWACLTKLREEGQTILVVDKYVNRLVGLADRHLILERGCAVWTGSSEQLNAHRELWTRYLGV